MRWHKEPGGALCGRLTYAILEGAASALLSYRYWPSGSGSSYEAEFVLASKPGKRTMALCPTPGCARRVRTLYAPPGSERFRCRICCGLVYRPSASQQLDAYFEAVAGPHLRDLAALPEGPLPVPRQPRRARLPAELAARLGGELFLGNQELRLWCLRLRQQGLSYRRIAWLLDCSKSSVARYCQAGRGGIDTGALICECEERVATPPDCPYDADARELAVYSRLLRRYHLCQGLRKSLRRPSPAELEERVLVGTEEPARD